MNAQARLDALAAIYNWAHNRQIVKPPTSVGVDHEMRNVPGVGVCEYRNGMWVKSSDEMADQYHAYMQSPCYGEQNMRDPQFRGGAYPVEKNLLPPEFFALERKPGTKIVVAEKRIEEGGEVILHVFKIPRFSAGAIPDACLRLPDAACFMKGR